jgi:L-glyceraldehyde 3-phosphate reductase
VVIGQVILTNSFYPAENTRQAARILRQLGTPCLIHQPSYSMFNRWVEAGLLDVLKEEGMGCIAFSPLAQMALACALRHETITSVVISASRVAQIDDAVGALQRLDFPKDELQRIETILG